MPCTATWRGIAEYASDPERKQRLQEWGHAEPWLREQLWEWDFLGISEHGGPKDEYDCLIPGLYSCLTGGHDRSHIARFLSEELSAHWGLPPEGSGPSSTAISGFVDDLVAGWELDRRGEEGPGR